MGRRDSAAEVGQLRVAAAPCVGKRSRIELQCKIQIWQEHVCFIAGGASSSRSSSSGIFKPASVSLKSWQSLYQTAKKKRNSKLFYRVSFSTRSRIANPSSIFQPFRSHFSPSKPSCQIIQPYTPLSKPSKAAPQNPVLPTRDPHQGSHSHTRLTGRDLKLTYQ